jgi:adenosylcobinamide-phosphate synthase
MSALLALLSLLIELAFGYPDRLYKAIGHPVTWIGALIAKLDAGLNRDSDTPRRRHAMGVVAAALIVIMPGALALAFQQAMGSTLLGLLAAAIAGSSLVAQRSLASHVKAVADALDGDGLDAGRKAVSQIVGRDPDRLDEAAVCRAAIESLAENFSDGIVAPAFWLGVGGLPCGVAYKAANTADSMIGHKTKRHGDFGWAAARFDDLINLPASRLTALLLVLAALMVRGADASAAWRAVWRDARRHRSPNAGWPEAAMAGALGLALAGPRVYGGVTVDDATMGNGRREASAKDIRKALQLYWTADALMIGLFAAIALAIW